MSCDERRLAAFLAGQLSDGDEQAFDEHLLTCEACWRAVREDRAGRSALEHLRVPSPPGLADRVVSSIRAADRSGDQPAVPAGGAAHRQGRLHGRGLRAVAGRPRRVVAVVAAALALLGGVLGWTLQGRTGSDPPQIARVVAMLSPRVAGGSELRAGERFVFGGQALTVRSYRVDGDVVLVATSGAPFPVPSGSQVLVGSSPSAWMAADGRLSMYGVNRPAGSGGTSMFLVAAMPMAQLPQVAARLHLI